jgi:2-dehydro-3-deoxyphosphogluconate aldolase / (4S)-4-hydroxy-2-oxoglutarate aldolase
MTQDNSSIKQTEFVACLRENPVVAILRRPKIDPWICVEALGKAGLKFVEITMESTQAIPFLNKARDQNDPRFLIGAGTVTSIDLAEKAIAAGAKFLVTPAFLPDVIDVSRGHGIPICCGAMTPTEIFDAYRAGADVVKVFPASTLGARFIKELRGPFPDIPLMATGGINEKNAIEFFEAGVDALGAGGFLVPKSDDQDAIEQCVEIARKLLAAKAVSN